MPNVRKNDSLINSRIRRDGLRAGTSAPAFRASGLYGETRSLSDWKGENIFLLFMDPHCEPCTQVAKEIQERCRSEIAAKIVAVSRGDRLANVRKAEELQITFPVLLQNNWEISKEFGIFTIPAAFLIDATGMIAKEVAIGPAPILALLRDVCGNTEANFHNDSIRDNAR